MSAGVPSNRATSPRFFRGRGSRCLGLRDRVDRTGRPNIAFSVEVDGVRNPETRRGDGGFDHRDYYAVDGMVIDGESIRWLMREPNSDPGEDDYTGLVADRHDPNTVVISTNADPVTGESLISSADGQRHWELFQGVTSDAGQTWSWEC